VNEVMPLQRLFEYHGNQVRMVVIDGEPWAVAKDVCEVLEVDPTQTRRLDDDEKGLCSIQTPGGPQEMVIVNEPGLYSLVLKSRKPEAKAFKRWITHEVIPSIRQTGRYDVVERHLPRTYLEALEELVSTERERVALAERVALDAPKVAVYEAALSAKNSLSMLEAAKALGWGRTRLFAELRERKILMNDNLPYQEHIDAGRFRVKVTPVVIREQTVNKSQTLVTPKGLDYLAKVLATDRRRVS
jgi:anti-repressor protein